ncbi:MAG: LLM class flavin-dependent oxidoreductase [Microbacterium sp.]
MRIALELPDQERAVEIAVAADLAGVSAVALPRGVASAPVAAAIAAETEDVRLLVPVTLGSDNPTTLAEEIAVVDHLSAGRTVAVVERGDLVEAEAYEDLRVLELAWSGRFVDLPARWRGDAPTRIAVTPAPAQLTLPMWSADDAFPHLPRIVEADADDATLRTAAAARTTVSGELEPDRVLIGRLAAAGTALAILALPPEMAVARYVARYLVPEAATPHFPRIIADSAWPASPLSH